MKTLIVLVAAAGLMVTCTAEKNEIDVLARLMTKQRHTKLAKRFTKRRAAVQQTDGPGKLEVWVGASGCRGNSTGGVDLGRCHYDMTRQVSVKVSSIGSSCGHGPNDNKLRFEMWTNQACQGVPSESSLVPGDSCQDFSGVSFKATTYITGAQICGFMMLAENPDIFEVEPKLYPGSGCQGTHITDDDDDDDYDDNGSIGQNDFVMPFLPSSSGDGHENGCSSEMCTPAQCCVDAIFCQPIGDYFKMMMFCKGGDKFVLAREEYGEDSTCTNVVRSIVVSVGTCLDMDMGNLGTWSAILDISPERESKLCAIISQMKGVGEGSLYFPATEAEMESLLSPKGREAFMKAGAESARVSLLLLALSVLIFFAV